MPLFWCKIHPLFTTSFLMRGGKPQPVPHPHARRCTVSLFLPPCHRRMITASLSLLLLLSNTDDFFPMTKNYATGSLSKLSSMTAPGNKVPTPVQRSTQQMRNKAGLCLFPRHLLRYTASLPLPCLQDMGHTVSLSIMGP